MPCGVIGANSGKDRCLIGWLGYVILISSCAPQEINSSEPPSTTYFVVSNIPSSSTGSSGAISTYEKPSETLTPLAYQPPVSGASTTEYIADAELRGENVYAVRSLAKIVDVLDASGRVLIKSIEYSTYPSTGSGRLITTGSDKVFVSDRSLSPGGDLLAYVFAVNVNDQNDRDSIAMPLIDAKIWSMACSNNHLFIGWSEPSLQNRIDVLDLNTHAVVKSFPLGAYLCYEMLLDRDDHVLAFTSSDSLIYIDAGNLEIKDRIKMPHSSLGVTNSLPDSRVSHCIDKPRNLIYFLADAPQPSSAPFLLYSHDLVNSLTKQLSPKFLAGSTIAFDGIHQTVLIGLSDFVSVYDVRARQLSLFSVPYFVSEIIVKE